MTLTVIDKQVTYDVDFGVTVPFMSPAQGAQVEIRIADGGVLAQLYSDKNGGTLLNNPFTLGADARILCYVESGRYDISVTRDNETVVYSDYQAVDDIVVEGPKGTLQFATVAEMINGDAFNQQTSKLDWANYLGQKVSTVYNNTTSKAGGAEYVIKTLAQAAADGDVIDGTGSPNYIGANHALSDGVHVAILRCETPVDVQKCGAILNYNVSTNTGTDDTTAINNALSIAKYVSIPPEKSARLDGTVVLFDDMGIHLGQGSRLRRTSHTSNTDPVVWIRGSSNSILGSGYGSSRIQTANDSPNGVVLLGEEDMTASTMNCNYNTIKDMSVWGRTPGGNTSGVANSCILLQAPEIGGKTVYFQNINSVNVSLANHGIELRGWANGNFISKVHGFNLGDNTKLGGSLIYDRGSLDNNFTDVFHHFSFNSCTLLLEEFDNTSNGGAIHKSFANSYKGIICEQSGPSARAIIATDSSVGGCSFEIKDNVSAGVLLDPDFNNRNSLFSLASWRTTARNISELANKHSYVNVDGTDARSYEQAFSLSGMSENVFYELLDFDINVNSSQLIIEFYIGTQHGSGIGASYAQKSIFAVSRSPSATVSSISLENLKSGDSVRGLCEPIISGSNVKFNYKTLNNGSSTNNQSLFCLFKITGHFSNLDVRDGLVVGGSATVLI